MTKDQIISITDLRKNATTYINELKKPKYVFVNNKPKAVLIDIDVYEKLCEDSYVDFAFDPPIDPKEILHEYKKTYGSKIH